MKKLLILLLAIFLVGCSTNEDIPTLRKAAFIIEPGVEELLVIEDDTVENSDDSDSQTESENSTNNDNSKDTTDQPSFNDNNSNNDSGNNSDNSNQNNNQQPNTPSPTPEPPKPDPTPTQACPSGKDPNRPCSDILDTNYYYATFNTYEDADAEGNRMVNEVEYLNGMEITNHSVQPIYRNDNSIAYYGLNLWSDGKLIK